MTKPEGYLIDWLRDAHAMELQAIKVMQTQVSRLEHYPELTSRLEQHIEETRGQAARLEECLKAHDADTSIVKDSAAQFAALMQGLGGVFVGDEVVKGAMVCHAFEQFEIGAYKILAAAAREAGDERTAGACEDILREEEAMADWLYDHLPEITARFLERKHANLEAKR
jgi:ferritin-like metal-binding protein YciE